MAAKCFVIFWLLISTTLYGQTDSLRQTDTAKNNIIPSATATSIKKDSVVVPVHKVNALTWQQDTAFNRFFFNKKLPKNKQSVYAINVVRQPAHEDEQFYILAGLLLFTGIVRAAFPKYFITIFQLFFQSAQRQRQSKENIAQDVLPSFLLNLIFIFSGGLLLTAFIKNNDFLRPIPFLLLWMYACAALSVVYIVKSLFITFFGWSFGAEEPAANYRSIVFLVNKIAGLFFIPLLLLLTYSNGSGFTVLTTIVIVVISILLLYRYIVSLSMAGKKLNINPVHFFLYLCAVEILPLLVTYKALLIATEL